METRSSEKHCELKCELLKKGNAFQGVSQTTKILNYEEALLP